MGYVEKDFLMRYLNQLGVVIAKLLGLKENGKFQEANQVIENSLLDFGLKLPELYLNINQAELLSKLKTKDDLNDGQMKVLAELLFQKGEVERELSNYDVDKQYYSRALILLEYLTDHEKVYSFERGERIDWIKSYIEN
ncbi:MAG: hypothetical protein PVH48_05910 [Cyclobacteriaceae bacterium]|jgi:hypothetical protein